MGLIPTPPEVLRHFRQYTRADAVMDLPSAVDQSANMPPVGNQGGQDSCVGWAVGYYHKTYQEKLEQGWDLSVTDHQFSPSFVYNQVNDGADGGTSLGRGYRVLKDKGCASLSVMPYTGFSVWPDQLQCELAMPCRADDATYVFSGQGQGADYLDAMKTVLTDGDILVVGFPVYSDFGVSAPDYLYDGPSGGATYEAGHALALVGYDDARGGVGGFKFYNSWGAGWGDGGTGWLSYDFVGAYAYEAWTMTDRTSYQPTAWARVDIDHPRRGQLLVRVGCGSNPASPDWSYYAYFMDGGNYADISTSVDISDATGYLPPSASNQWFVSVQDYFSDYTGTITGFAVILSDGTKYLSSDTPVSIPDDHTLAVAYADYTGVTVSPSGPTTLNDLLATVSGGGQGSYSFAWYKDGVLQPDEASNLVSHTKTSKGETWKCVARPLTPLGSPGESSVTIRNSPPSLLDAGIEEPDPQTADDLVVSASSTDADGDPVAHRYVWTRNGVSQPDETGPRVAHANTSKGDEWTCTVTPNDGTDDGSSADVSVVIANTAPVLDWCGTSGYGQDGVSPDEGVPRVTRFFFRARIADSDGIAPAHMQVEIQRLQDARQWVTVATPQLRARPGSWADGKTCVTSRRLPNGVFRYRFVVADDEGARATGQPCEWHVGPTMHAGPQLWCTGLPGRESDGLEPASGLRGTRFKFSVLYTDSQGDTPHVYRLALQRKARDGGWRDFGPFTLKAWGGSAEGGKIFSLARRLPKGKYRHRFVFRDDDGPAMGSLTKWQLGPHVSSDRAANGGTLAIASLTATPSPVGSSIVFSLTAPASVDARVLNIAGRAVRTLARSRDLPSGTHTLLWNCQADTGLFVPAGTYLVEVVALSPDGTRVRSIRPLSVGR